ncbi:MAG: hypothetical protein JXA93_16065 [Anaerolineae bacterium]|nr:hypothetical protein [Anaerolineae bacterium]
MDEVLRRKRLWIGLGIIGMIFLCVMTCALGALLTLMPWHSVANAPAPYVAPQADEGGAAPQVYQGPMVGRHSGFGPLGIVGLGFRLLLKLLFFGLLLVLGLRLMRHLLGGPRHWCAPYWGPYYQGRPPKGAPEGGERETGWGPPPWVHKAWQHHRPHWGPPPWWGPGQEQAGGKPAADVPAADVPAADVPGDEYTGPQE